MVFFVFLKIKIAFLFWATWKKSRIGARQGSINILFVAKAFVCVIVIFSLIKRT